MGQITAPQPGSLDWLTLDEFTFHHTLPKLAGVTLVLFGQPGCSACRSWHHQLMHWALPILQQRVYVDVQTSMALAREFDIFHLPALHIYRDGHYHGPLQCQLSQQAIEAAISQLLARPAQEAP